MKNVILLFTVIVLAFASCSLDGTGDGAADITLSFGSGASRALETDWTGGAFPTLSSITVTVSADDMRTVTKTVPGDQRRISVRVPFGKDRLVEVTAVPASPGVAASYSGSGLTDVGYRATASLRIAVELSGSALLLPNYPQATGNLYEAKLFSGGLTSSVMNSVVTSVNSDFEFDDHGRIYIGTATGIERVTALSGGTVEPVFPAVASAANGGIAYDSSSHRVYFVNRPLTGGQVTLHFADITQAIPNDVTVTLPGGFATLGNAIAADSGSVYVVSESATVPRIVRLSVGDATGMTATSTEAASASFASLGLTVAAYKKSNTVGDTSTLMKVEDMMAKDSVLYIAASQSNAFTNVFCSNGDAFCRGKILALQSTDLASIWDSGWAGDANNFPTDPTTQFYLPCRIVGIMPKKLYIADDGHTWLYDADTHTYSFSNMDRVMEVDTESHTTSSVSLDIGAVGFFHSFNTISVC
jgi:hypothetical protein